MAIGFLSHIKPYFTPCYRAHMLNATGGDLDLWEFDNVKDQWPNIKSLVSPPGKSMPRVGCGEGVWDDLTRTQFLKDFEDWKAAQFPA